MTQRVSRRGFVFVIALSLLVPSLSLTARAQATPIPAGATVVASDIANPRGVTWDASGTMYLAVSGQGGDTPGPEGSPFFGGMTGSVVTVKDGVVTPLVETMPSTIWKDMDLVWGVMDVAILGDHLYALDGGGGALHGNPDVASGVYQVNADGTTNLVADLGTWVDANPVAHTPPEGAQTHGSFFAMVPVGDALWVTDAVNGQILQVTPDGAISRIADLSEGHPVPAGLAADPNGGVYVGFLTAAPFSAGTAKVSHVAPDGTVEDVWTGLTTVTAVEIGPDGSLYAAEMSSDVTAAEPFLTPNSGQIVRQTGPDTHEVVVDGLAMPVSARFGRDGMFYVSGPAIGSDAGTGEVLRIDLSEAAAVATPGMATPVT
jgi:hypothetical protein